MSRYRVAPQAREDIKEIYPKDKSILRFKFDPKRRVLSKGYKWHIPKGIQGEVKYGIKFIDNSGEEIDVDPLIVVPPPPDDPQ